METKRCTYCHKLQRAETRVCSRCGRSFERRRSRSGKPWRSSVSLFSLPPASPHHAGHYSGLHPEDQPYQSNKIVTPRRVPKDSKEKGTLPQEPGQILLPATQNTPATRMYRDSSQVSTRRQVPARRSRRQFQQEEALSESQETQKTVRRTRRNAQIPRPFARDVDYDLASPLDETQQPLRTARLASTEIIPEIYRQEFELAETYRPQRSEYAEGVDDELITQFSPVKNAVLLPANLPTYMQAPSYAKPRYSRIMSTVLVAAGFFFLLATSIIVLVLMGNRPLLLHAQLKITPQLLGIHDTFSLEGNGFTPKHTVIFMINTNTAITGDNDQPLQAITDSRGHFSVHSIVPSTWSVGSHIIYAIDQGSGQRFSANITVKAPLPTPPHLRLSTNQDSFGSSASGVVSSQTITLENTGGGTVVWQESCDQPWLTTSPNSGTFTGSENIQINVNRGGMVPRDYTGLVTIKQQGQGNTPSVLHVTMTVAPTPAQMSVSVTTLSYSTAQSQAPNGQILTIGNTGEQSLHWDATVSTEDGAPWLTLSLYHGVLPSGVSQSLNVEVASESLTVGTYTGLISFTGNADAQVEVSLNVVAPGDLVISPPSLTFGVATTQQTSQTLSLQNSGGSSLDWTVTSSTNDHGNWLSVMPASGTLAPGESATISVHVDATNLAPGSYQGTLTFASGDQTKQLLISFVVTGTTPTPVSPTATSTPTATVSPAGN
jgi:Viral BACON domain